MSKYLNVINQVGVKNPCPIPKSQLQGNALGDYCLSCEKQVYDLSKLSKFEALSLLKNKEENPCICLLYTSPSPRDATLSRMPSSA